MISYLGPFLNLFLLYRNKITVFACILFTSKNKFKNGTKYEIEYTRIYFIYATNFNTKKIYDLRLRF